MRYAVPLVPILAFAAACGGNPPTAPTATLFIAGAPPTSVRSVSISASQTNRVRVGGTEQLTSFALSGAPPRWIDCVASWQSSRPDVATVAQSGIVALLTARAAGASTITATCDDVSASIEVQVTAG